MLWPRIVLGLLALAVFAGANFYVYRRTVADTIRTIWARRALAAAMAMLFLALPIIRFAWRGQMPPPGFAEVVLIGWGLFLYTLQALLVVELVKWIARRRKKSADARLKEAVDGGAPAAPENPDRRLFLSRVAATSALAVSGGVVSFGTWKAFTPPAINEIPVKLIGLPKALDGFTIVQLSDIHVGAIIQEKFLDQLVQTANSAKPDLLAITGDLVDGSPDALGRYVARLRNLQSRFGTYFVSGNHDYYAGWEEWSRELEGIDFEVLRNRTVSIGDPGASFDLIGVDDWGSRWQPNGYDFEAAVKERDQERASVLLCHQPNGLEAHAAKKVGLQLSGHTHGGQLFPANLVGQMIWGNKNEGLSVQGYTQLYTSRGCGFVGPPMRVGAPPEVVKIVLVAG